MDDLEEIKSERLIDHISASSDDFDSNDETKCNNSNSPINIKLLKGHSLRRQKRKMQRAL